MGDVRLVIRAGEEHVFRSALAGQVAIFKEAARDEVEPVLDVLHVACAAHAVGDDSKPATKAREQQLERRA